MDNYADLKLLPIEAQSPPHLLNSIFGQLHLALVSRGKDDVAVSFPRAHKKGLGNILRIHGQASVIDEILTSNRFKRLKDYYRASEVRSIPPDYAWKHVSRQQPVMTAAKVRRLVARGSITDAQAEICCRTLPRNNLPFVQLCSSSSGHRYKLFISQVDCDAPKETQRFNTYGLGGSVPWF